MDIDLIAKEYCQGIADALAQTMQTDLPYPQESIPLWNRFIADVAHGDYTTHFNFRVVNGEISIQAKTNVGLAITDYVDMIQGEHDG